MSEDQKNVPNVKRTLQNVIFIKISQPTMD